MARQAVFLLILVLISSLGVSLEAKAEIRTEMKLFSDSFISSSFEATEKTNYQFIGAHLKTLEPSEDILHLDIAGGAAFGAPLLNYLNFSEFYVDLPIAEEQSLSIGRKRDNWSDLDARWELGIWEPLFKWNPLSPDRQGLLGVFWDVDKKDFGISLFASPLYLPDEGPSFEIENGQFVNGNPWFQRPPDTLRLFNETARIQYRFEKPNESQIVLQRSFGGKLRLGDPQALRFQLSYMYKPANQLALGYDGVLDIPTNSGIVDLQPAVFYHSLTGADLSYKLGHFRFGTSVTIDRPSQSKIFEDKWTHPVFEDATLWSNFIEFEMRSFKTYLQRLDITGGRTREEGDLASPNRRAMMVRYRFYQATEVGLVGQYAFSRHRRLTSGISMARSDQNDFSLVKFNGKLKLSQLWALYSELQLISAGPLTQENQNEIAQFANNDRFLVGVIYVF